MNEKKIEKTEMEIETHPLTPFLPKNAKYLFLGSFPPPRQRWSMEFYYPNMQNDFWRIMGTIFFKNAQEFIIKEKKTFNQQRIEKFLIQEKIAIYDAAYQVQRLKSNASDQFLVITQATDLKSLLNKIPDCDTIIVTGEKAGKTVLEPLKMEIPKVGQYCDILFFEREIRFWRMPSSSRAYPLPLNEKATTYSQIFFK